MSSWRGPVVSRSSSARRARRSGRIRPAGAPLRDARGMSLAEIVAAVGIIGIGLAALAAAIPLSAFGLQEGNQQSTAAFLAEERLEQLKAALWTGTPAVDCLGTSANWSFDAGGTAPSGIGAGCTPASFSDESPASNPLPLPHGGYTRQVRIRDCSAGGAGCPVSDSRLRLVAVRVSYTPLQGIGGVATAPKSVELRMLVTRR
jgi:Tfp pilus assembly protein PilV